jgi:CHAT domain-containing protein
LDSAADDALEIAPIREASPDREDALRQLCAAGYEHLLMPIGELLAAEHVSRVLLSVPGGFSGLPFEAFTKERGGAVLKLGDREISCVLVPSLRLANDLLVRRQALPVRSADAVRALVVGYQGDDLPGVGKELDALKAVWGTRLTVLDGPISRHDVLDALQGDFDVLHIMGHATHNMIEPGESAIHLVEDEARDTARVTADDLLSMRPFQRAPVVILSACSSAVTADTRTNAYHGLAGSLLRRGACGVIGSRWPVYDDTAAALMSALHGGLSRGVVPHQALRDAGAALRADGRGIEDWAAFSYIGIP